MSFRKKFGNLKGKLLYGYRATSESMLNYMRKSGVRCGVNCVFYEPYSCTVDMTNPKLLTLGDNVRITHGVTILTHDYSWSVISGVYGECLGGVAPVTIGNNVFIGMNTTILKGSVIGDNVIIGAGSVVSGNCDSNSVYAGNPVMKIRTLEEHYRIRKRKSHEEALQVAYRMRNEGREALSVALREWVPLFTDPDDERMTVLMRATGYYEKCRQFYGNGGVLQYGSIDELLEEAMKKRGK